MGRRVPVALLLLSLLAWGVFVWSDSETGSPDTPPARTTETPDAAASDRGREHVTPEPTTVPDRDLDPAAVWAVSGTIRDDDETPLAGMHVELRRPAEPTHAFFDAPIVVEGEVLGTTTSADDGSYEIDTGEVAPLVIRAHGEGFVPDSTLVKTDRPTDLHLSRGATREILVVEERDEPVAGAQVWPHQASLPEGFSVTDAGGRVRLLIAPDEELTVRATGYAEGWGEVADFEPADDPIRVVLAEGRVIRGHVVDEDGAPLAGIPVAVQDTGTRTGADGSFELIGFDAGGWHVEDGLWLHADAPGWCGGEHVDVWPGQVDVEVVLRKSGTVRGIVVDTNGVPVAGARVRGQVTTDADGRFELVDFESGSEFLWAEVKSTVDGRVSDSGSVDVEIPSGGVLEGVRIIVEPRSRETFVTVRVLNADGTPAAKADVMAWMGDVEITDNRVGTDGTRAVRVSPRPGVPLRVAALARGLPVRDAYVEVDVTPTATEPFPVVDLQLGPPGRFALRLVDTIGRAVPFDLATVEPLNDLPFGKDGTWELPATQQFYAELVVPGYGRRTLHFDPPHARPREETIVLLPAARVFGRVVDSEGLPASDEINVVAAIDVPGTEQWEWGDVSLDEDGRFEMEGLPPGDVEFRVFHINDVLHYHPFTITAGIDVDLGTIELTPPVTLRGKVTRRGGTTIGGALLRLLDRGGVELGEVFTTRSDGTFQIDLPAAIPIGLRVSRPGFGTRIVEIVPDGSEVEIELGPGGRICTHDDDVDYPPGFWWFEARLPGTDRAWRLVVPDDWDADDDGDLFEDLPAGPLDIVLTLGDGRELVRRVEIVPGGTVECVFAD